MGLTSLAWGLAGLMVAIVPAMGPAWARRVLLDPWWRFWFAHVILLMGLLLMIGTADLKGSLGLGGVRRAGRDQGLSVAWGHGVVA